MGGRKGIEPSFSEPQSDALPLNYQPHIFIIYFIIYNFCYVYSGNPHFEVSDVILHTSEGFYITC